MLRSLRYWIFTAGVMLAGATQAQVTQSRTLSSSTVRTATLEEQLINELRATKDDQKAFIRYVVKKVNSRDLERRLVLAVERYAIRRNRFFPFPYFERAIRFEAAKRKVILPAVQTFATSKAKVKR